MTRCKQALSVAQTALYFAGSSALFGLGIASCLETRGSSWMAQPLPGADGEPTLVPAKVAPTASASGRSQTSSNTAPKITEGHLLGTFRNTYYNFPRETQYSGAAVSVMNASCEKIADVPRSFFESLCVQGSGHLKNNSTVSFARRDCECAEICPRTNQKICFEALDSKVFPWGRGAAGKPISPLRTVAVDSNLIPLGTVLYIPAYEGFSRPDGKRHDGCFVAEDRGLRVQGTHVDIFVGDTSVLDRINQAVPSNQGVQVFSGIQLCEERLGAQ